MKLCRECKHITLDWTCDRVTTTNPVDGTIEKMPCAMAREPNAACGPDAKLFEEAKENQFPEAA